MGKAGEECLDPWKSEIARIGQKFSRSLEIEATCFSFHTDRNTRPDRFLGIDGQAKRNTEIFNLACDVVDEKITYDDAVEELKIFTESLFDKPKGDWEQLPLWSQSELDQL